MIGAKIIADSISKAGKRITTFELEFPRFVLAEFNTHRALSRNSASSRAIPISKVIEGISLNPAMPVFWGQNQAGMQAAEELSDKYEDTVSYYSNLNTPRQLAKIIWLEARDSAIEFARRLSDLGLHKQIVNRILEPWVVTKVVATATEWDNFFYLRNHKDAQPEIHELARQMWEVYKTASPKLLDYDEWHLPYIEDDSLELEDALKLSASLCAQTSYRKSDDTLEKAYKIYDKLIESKPAHSSPLEHQARPLIDPTEKSGNLTGWHQYRQDIPDNVCLKYEE